MIKNFDTKKKVYKSICKRSVERNCILGVLIFTGGFGFPVLFQFSQVEIISSNTGIPIGRVNLGTIIKS